MRAAADDLLQGFRFHVTANDGTDSDPLQRGVVRGNDFEGGGQAGFQSATIPEITLEAAEYREGTFVWTQKYPGPPTVSDLSLIRGISKQDTAFYDMCMASVNGQQYRADVTVWHYQRAEMGSAAQSETADTIRHLECRNAFAMRAKPAGDMDATSGEVSMAEVDIAMESFVLIKGE